MGRDISNSKHGSSAVAGKSKWLAGDWSARLILMSMHVDEIRTGLNNRSYFKTRVF